MTSKRDLALAYSPGVAAPVKKIANNLLNVLGNLNATKKASAKKLVPKKIAIKISLT